MFPKGHDLDKYDWNDGKYLVWMCVFIKKRNKLAKKQQLGGRQGQASHNGRVTQVVMCVRVRDRKKRGDDERRLREMGEQQKAEKARGIFVECGSSTSS